MKHLLMVVSLFLLVLGSLSACGGGGGGSDSNQSSQTPIEVEPKTVVLNDQLTRPWGMAFLPDRRMLVTEKGGRLLLLSVDGATIEGEVLGVPTVVAASQGGLLDVALDPDFATTPWVYWSYSEPGSGGEEDLSGTAVARGLLIDNALHDVEVIYRQTPKVRGSGHFGSRLVFGRDQTLYVTLGDRQRGAPAQDLASTLGKVVRIQRDGSIPADNPSLPGALPEIWSYGHRNPQGAALRPSDGQL